MRLNEELLRRAWIAGVSPERFQEGLEQALTRLPSAPGPVLVAERDPIDFLILFFAALTARRPVVLGNFAWGRQEWEQAFSLTCPAAVFCSGPPPACPGGADKHPPSLLPGEILIPTGGSSGRLRFARHSWRTLATSAEAFRRFYGVPAVNSLCLLPLFHVSGLMQAVRSLLSGGRFVPLGRQQVEEGKVPRLPHAFLSLVPTQLQRFLAGERDISWMRRLAAMPIGGASIRPDLLEAARRRNLPLSPSYGMTETAAMITALSPNEFLAGGRSSGRPLSHAAVRVVSDRGALLPSGACGVVEIRAGSLCHGYLPVEATPGEWWLSGDVGCIDAEGFLHVQGRAGRWISSGGEKVSLAEVEEVLEKSGLVKEAWACGVEDPEWGQALAVVFVPRSPEESARLRSALKAQLSPHKVPKHLFAVTELPRTPAGKIDRTRVEQLAGRKLVEETAGSAG